MYKHWQQPYKRNKEAASSWSPSEDSSSKNKPGKGECDLRYKVCLVHLLKAKLRNNPYHWEVSYEKRIHSLLDRLATACESMHGKRDRRHPTPHYSKLLSRSTLCCSAEIFEKWASTKGLSTKAKHPNPNVLTSFGWNLYSSTLKLKLHWQPLSFLT